MTPFTTLEGPMAVLPQANINTDAIIPSPGCASPTPTSAKACSAPCATIRTARNARTSC